MTDSAISKSQQLSGKLGSTPLLMEMKCAFQVWIALSARFCLWSPGEASWNFRSLSFMAVMRSLEISLSSLRSWPVNPA